MASTPLLGLALPTDGTTNWGTLVNTSITALLDSAVAGTTTISSATTPYVLTTTLDAANEARQAIILCTGSRAAIQTIVAPYQSKTYVVINATTGGFGVQIVGVGPTTGVTVPNGRACTVAWNGSDFVITGFNTVNLAADVTGTLPVTNGGTGVTLSTGSNAVVLNTSPTIVSPVLTGTPTAPTAVPATNSTQVATTAFVQSLIPGTTDGSIGSYMMATYEGASAVVFGDTVAGSLLRPINIAGTSTGATQFGTWRCLGAIVAYGGGTGPYTSSQLQGGSTIWLRIS